MDLTDSQQEILSVLVSEYQTNESPVTGEEIADALDQHPGTIRKQMQSLTALDLVTGIPGPGGGYKPTVNAYAVLDRQTLDEAESLILAREDERSDVTVEAIDFVNVHDPENCRADVTIQEDVTQFSIGDPIIIGPTPQSDLVLAGQVEEIDAGANQLHLDVARLEAPLAA